MLVSAGACGFKFERDPQAVYDQIFDKIVHGDLKSAVTEADQAYQLFQSKSPEWAWRFRILEAQALVTQSRGQEALSVLQGDLPPSLASSDVAVRKPLFEGAAYRITQDFPAAERKLTQAEQEANASQPALLGEVLNARGALEFDQKDYASAEASFHRALALARSHGLPRQELAALGNMVRITITQRHFGQAIDESASALELARSLRMGSIEAALLGNLGWCYFQLGDFENALVFFQQAREASGRLSITGNSFFWEANVAEAHQELHEYAKARELFRRVLDNAAKIDNKQTMTESLNSLVRLDLITGQTDEADQNNRKALGIEEAGLDHFGVLESLFLEGRIEILRGDFAGAEKLFRQVIADRADADSLKWEAVSGFGRSYDAQSSVVPAAREYRRSIELFESARASIERDELRISFLARGIETYEAYIDFLVRHSRSIEGLMIADKSRSRTLADGLRTATAPSVLGPGSMEPRQLANHLGATLLLYWLGEQRSYLWVISSSKVTNIILPSAQEIDPLVKLYREALTGTRDPLASASAAGQKLYSILIQPAASLIPQNSRVVVLPDGSLYGLNFEALIAPQPRPHYWIEDVTLTTGSSLSLLAAADLHSGPKQRNLFLMGDTIPPNNDFPKLTRAAEEIKNIEKYFSTSNRKVFSGTDATPSAYLRNSPENYAYIHFATHGTASRARPLESAVVLSRERDEDSYKLYARQIVGRRLSADLVTISACNASGTRTFSGEGLVGLSWAFLRAGAHNVIGALWEVSDSSTPQLMDVFYDALSHGKDPATALRAAKLSLLHSDSVFRKPRYWAPFQLYAGS